MSSSALITNRYCSYDCLRVKTILLLSSCFVFNKIKSFDEIWKEPVEVFSKFERKTFSNI